MKTKQLDNGIQHRPYADHIYKWEVEAENNESQEEVLAWCRKNLRDAKREKEDYFHEYRRMDISFNEKMNIVCGGYYSIQKIGENKYIYQVIQEYID